VLAASKAPAADAAAASDDTASSRKNAGTGAWPACTLLPDAGDAAVCDAAIAAAEGPPNVGWPVGEEAMVYSAGKVFRQARYRVQARINIKRL
jgi:hypothetical protein